MNDIHFDAKILESLYFQYEEGVNEWVLDEAEKRFDKPESKPVPSKKISIQNNDARTQAQTTVPRARQITQNKALPIDVDWSGCDSVDDIFALMDKAVPEAVRKFARSKLLPLGLKNAPIVIIGDPPKKQADQMAQLEADISVRIFVASLQAINLNLGMPVGKTPRAECLYVPISPWRLPADRKFIDSEISLFQSAMERLIALTMPKLILLAGSNLAGLDMKIKDDNLFGVPVVQLISPVLMAHEPTTKREQWRRLLVLSENLDNIL